MVDRNAHASAKNAVGFDRLIRIHVDRRHEPAGFVRADGKQGQPGRSELVADPAEVGAKGGVAREVDDAKNGVQDVAAPEGLVTVEKSSPGKVEGGDGMDGGARDGQGVTPIELVCGPDASRFEEVGDAERRYEYRTTARGQAAERQEVEVIVMVVAEKNGVHAREVVECDAGLSMPARSGE